MGKGGKGEGGEVVGWVGWVGWVGLGLVFLKRLAGSVSKLLKTDGMHLD